MNELTIEYNQNKEPYGDLDAAQVNLLIRVDWPTGDYRALFAKEYTRRMGPFDVMLFSVMSGWIVVAPDSIEQFLVTANDRDPNFTKLWAVARAAFVKACAKLMEVQS